MVELQLQFNLPRPWEDKTFTTSKVGVLNFLVGPNGSGKSRFSDVLKGFLPSVRTLNTDRLNGMESDGGIMKSIWGDHLAQGLQKVQFGTIKSRGISSGSGLDAIILLEERLDLRIQVEATLSHLFNRNIFLKWDSGNLVPHATLGSQGTQYRLDRDECHGIKELLVLLTHLYNQEHKSLIIDEPELNLHPQFQAFFMQEVRKVAGDPKLDPTKKLIFLITHSPFILDFKSAEDLKSVISFDLKHREPKHLFDLDKETTDRLGSIVPRLNVHHKQLFFSDNPIFVEGILDAQLVAAIQEARNVSVAAAGSCIIDAGGCEEVNHYLTLCLALGKDAYFLYDLDSLFNGNLKSCIGADETVKSFLATQGLGNDLAKYFGDLCKDLTKIIDAFIASSDVLPSLASLQANFKDLGPRTGWKQSQLDKSRVAVLTAIVREQEFFIKVTSKADIANIGGRLEKICAALQGKNVFLLPGGTIESYLPSFEGDPYSLSDSAKSAATKSELEFLVQEATEEALKGRYGDLYKYISMFPAKTQVDVDKFLKRHVSDYIHDLQGAIASRPTWTFDELKSELAIKQANASPLISLISCEPTNDGNFQAVVQVLPILNSPKRHVVINRETNAGMLAFTMNPVA